MVYLYYIEIFNVVIYYLSVVMSNEYDYYKHWIEIHNKGLHRGDEMTRENYELAPDFRLSDVEGVPVNLSDFEGNKNVVLVFNRGFM